MKNTNIVAAALAALSLAAAVPAEAATRVQGTDTFLSGDGKTTFSVALTPFSGSVSVMDIAAPAPTQVITAQGTLIARYAYPDAAHQITTYVQTTNSTTGAYGTSGVFNGTYQGHAAPVTADGSAYAGNYYGIGIAQAGVGVYGSGTHNFYDKAANGSLSNDKVNYLSMLWGSVESYNSIVFTRSTGSGGTTTITGAEILAAAADLGLGAGNSGSYYVAFDDNAGGFYQARAMASRDAGGQSMDYALLSYSETRQALVPTAPAGAAPAPLPALAGTPFGLAAVAMFMRRRRKGPAAA